MAGSQCIIARRIVEWLYFVYRVWMLLFIDVNTECVVFKCQSRVCCLFTLNATENVQHSWMRAFTLQLVLSGCLVLKQQGAGLGGRVF